MDYNRRMLAAVAGSLLFHVVALGVGGLVDRRYGLGPAEVPAPPLVLNLQASEEQPSRRLVETAVPAREPVGETDLISDKNSRAQDPQEAVDGKVNAPLADEPSDSFELAGGAAEPAPPVPARPAEQPKPEKKPAEKKSEEKPVRPRREEKPRQEPRPAPAMAAEPDKPVAIAKAETGPPAVDPEPAPDEPGDAERQQTAQAPEPGLLPTLNPGKFRGSLDGGIKGKGFVGFEAMQDQLAPYMLEVRRRVERNWHMAMSLTYTGTIRTKAVVDCVIAPDGKLVKVEIVSPGNTPTYAPLCKESIEKSAPFPPFPFKVPDIYRNKNLEIRWTFNFL